jgi:starvation-inducible DNA-binding protein
MAQLNQIGLDSQSSELLADKLNELLANYQLFYINTRGFHWNIKGEKFFELHAKFEELYNDLFLKIDEIAERILTLGHTPLHSYEDYLAHTSVTAAHNISDGNECVQSILDSYSTILPIERELLELSGDSGDEGTNALMSDYIREQEKLVWMYSSFMAN